MSRSDATPASAERDAVGPHNSKAGRSSNGRRFSMRPASLGTCVVKFVGRDTLTVDKTTLIYTMSSFIMPFTPTKFSYLF